MLETLDQYSILTAVVFVSIGIALCFFGFKIYKDMIMFFMPLMIVILCFYLYMSYIEKSTTHNSKILIAVGVLFVVMMVIGALMAVTNFIFFLLAALASYKLGLLIHTFLEKKYEFFQQDLTEYIIVIVLFAALVFMFTQIKDYFVVLSTSILGSSFVILSFHYFHLTEFDFLFEMKFTRFKDYTNLETQYINFLVIFVLFVLTGSFLQTFFFLNRNKREIDIELNFKN